MGGLDGGGKGMKVSSTLLTSQMALVGLAFLSWRDYCLIERWLDVGMTWLKVELCYRARFLSGIFSYLEL